MRNLVYYERQMKRLFGSLLCVFTALLIFGGTILSSFSFVSVGKWSESISKLLTEEECEESYIGADGDFHWQNASKYKKQPLELLPFSSAIFSHSESIRHFELTEQIFRYTYVIKYNSRPLWLMVRHILI